MSSKNNEVVRTTLLVASATLAGLTVGVLFAPQAGQRTRRDVMRFGSKLADQAEALSENLKDCVDDLTSCVSSVSEQGIGKGKEVHKRLKGTLESSRDSIARQIQLMDKLVKG